MSDLIIAGKTFHSRLFLGTGKFSSAQAMEAAIQSSQTEMVTVALKRVDLSAGKDPILFSLKSFQGQLLPNTSGARDAKEAVFAAKMAREALGTPWLKLEIHPDPRWLLPDSIETLKAAEILVKEGFIVLPYIQADPVICKRLEEVGCAAVMPLGAPIGSNQGLKTKAMLEIIIEQSQVPVVIDAGLGAPSHACEAMEMGADACLVNTALAVAGDPLVMGKCFKMAVEAGRAAYESGLPAADYQQAIASSPLTSFLD